MSLPSSSTSTIGRGHALGVGTASVFSAGVSYVVLLIAARHLTPADNAVFLVFWAVLFGGFGVVTGVSPEAARAVHDGSGAGTPDSPDTPDSPGTPDRPATSDTSVGPAAARARIVPVALVLGTAVALALAVSSLGWGGLVLPDHRALIWVGAAAAMAYSGHLSFWGLLTGLRRWRAVAGLQIAESAVRLAAVCVAVLAAGGVSAMAVASAVSAATWLLTLVWPAARRQVRRRADVGAGSLLANFARSCGASASSAVLTVGFPVLIALTSTRAEILGAAGLLLAISLARAPLMVPLTAFQGVALTHFMRQRARGVGALLPILAVIGAATVVAAPAAPTLGPWLYRLLLGGRYTISGLLLGGLVLTAGLLAGLTISGMCCLALHRHSAYLGGWVVAVVVAVAALFLPLELSARVVSSLGVGPLAGLVVHLVALGRGQGGSTAQAA